MGNNSYWKHYSQSAVSWHLVRPYGGWTVETVAVRSLSVRVRVRQCLVGLDVNCFKHRESTPCYTAKIHILLRDNTMLLSFLFGNKILYVLGHFSRHYYFFNITRTGILDIVIAISFPMKTRCTSLMRESSMVKNTHSLFRGPGCGSQHPPAFISGYRGCDAPLHPIGTAFVHVHARAHTHTDTWINNKNIFFKRCNCLDISVLWY